MYSIKQKSKLLRELHNPPYAEADLNLLREVSPQDGLLKPHVAKAPGRFAERILYSLLDHTTAEKIRLNRRASEHTVTSKEADPAGTKPVNAGDSSGNEGINTENPTQEPPGGCIRTGNTPVTGIEQRVDELTQILDDTLSEKDGIQSELEETEATLEQTQEELELVKSELEDEKKSPGEQ